MAEAMIGGYVTQFGLPGKVVVTTILTVLLRGDDGEAYNAANEDTYCSIRELAELVSDSFGAGASSVSSVPQPPAQLG